jgi:hypothetical protein
MDVIFAGLTGIPLWGFALAMTRVVVDARYEEWSKCHGASVQTISAYSVRIWTSIKVFRNELSRAVYARPTIIIHPFGRYVSRFFPPPSHPRTTNAGKCSAGARRKSNKVSLALFHPII